MRSPTAASSVGGGWRMWDSGCGSVGWPEIWESRSEDTASPASSPGKRLEAERSSGSGAMAEEAGAQRRAGGEDGTRGGFMGRNRESRTCGCGSDHTLWHMVRWDMASSVRLSLFTFFSPCLPLLAAAMETVFYSLSLSLSRQKDKREV